MYTFDVPTQTSLRYKRKDRDISEQRFESTGRKISNTDSMVEINLKAHHTY